MRILVYAYFYPPSTTSEAIVTYKLLKNSSNEYDVFTANSDLWSYKIDSDLKASNVNVFSVNTDDLVEYVKSGIDFYEKNVGKYDFIMLRSTPPDSQLIGIELKKKYPNIKIISSFGDPVFRNPYEINTYIDENKHKIVKNMFNIFPNFTIFLFSKVFKKKSFELLYSLKKIEEFAIKNFDIAIFPSQNQSDYTYRYYSKRIKVKSLIIPHSFDSKLYEEDIGINSDKFTFLYIGHLDEFRSPEILIRAVKLLKKRYDNNREGVYDKIKIKIVGNIPQKMEDMVNVFLLDDVFEFCKPVNYFESLKMMKSADCLIHIDAYFERVAKNPIFFAAKLADYIGAKKHILGITPKGSTAESIIKEISGSYINVNNSNVDTIEKQEELAKLIEKIYETRPSINEDDVYKYDAVSISKKFDGAIENYIRGGNFNE